MSQPSIFVSYAWKAEEELGLVDKLEKAFQENGIHLNRDKHLEYKDSITEFMGHLARADCIIVVLSKAYLESENCMWELLTIHQNGEFRKRVFPLVLEGTRINKAEDRGAFLGFWDQKIANLKTQILGLDPIYTTSIHESLDMYAEIRRGIDKQMALLGDMNSLTQDFHFETNFAILLTKIREQFPIFAKPESDQAASEKFRQKVHSILNEEIERPVCRQLKDALISESRQADGIRALENSCQQENNGLEQAVKWLYSATKKTLRGMIDRNAGDQEQERFFGAAQNILGWLILLSVNDHWLGKNQKLFQNSNKSIRIDLPARTDAAIEIVLSRYKQVPARFEVNQTGSAVYGRHTMDTTLPESGWGRETAWQDIKLTIWNRLFKETRSRPLSEQETQRLRTLLEFRSDEGNNYYFTIRPSDEQSPLSRQEIVEKFREELPALKLIGIGFEGEQPVLLASEINLEVLIMEFLNIRRAGYDY
ncbi:MAG: toll/interleukin-1 receptor domain-containing protein [Methylococcaceae bacterium]|nr:toll/interleukin-1 receptor domain-containing protein [Methylococcaceae bacterium]